ncbi:MAG: hypothetical protein RR007_01520 [Kiritimatiellia bacterium]
MRLIRTLLLLLCTLGFAWCGSAVAPGNWLTPACTKTDPYSFINKAGQEIKLPNSTYKEWSVFNALREASELPDRYTLKVTEATSSYGAGMLPIAMDTSTSTTIGEDESAFLVLGIREKNMDPTPLPLPLDVPVVGGAQISYQSVSLKMRLIESDSVPNMNVVTNMYQTVADRTEMVDGKTSIAAKLAFCVLTDGYIYVSRVRSGTAENPGTGKPEDFIYEFCRTDHQYSEFDGGAVIVRILFKTLKDVNGNLQRGCSLFMKKDEAGATEVCISRGIGYQWSGSESTGEGAVIDWGFDFSSLGKGDWLFAIDSCLFSGGAELERGDIDRLQRIAFSAAAGSVGGGLYSAWLAKGTTVTAVAGSFASVASSAEGSDAFGRYETWVSSHNVSLTGDASANDKLYDEYLLNLPPDPNTAQELSISGLNVSTINGQKAVSLTVLAPEGVNLQNANARICLRRAATLEALSSATPTYYSVATVPNGNQAHIALPCEENGVELPFMKATLEPLTSPKTTTSSLSNGGVVTSTLSL